MPVYNYMLKKHSFPKFPKLLAKFRIQAGLSQNKLAKLLGYTQVVSVNRWERGLVVPTTGNLAKLAKILKVSLTDLVG